MREAIDASIHFVRLLLQLPVECCYPMPRLLFVLLLEQRVAVSLVLVLLALAVALAVAVLLL